MTRLFLVFISFILALAGCSSTQKSAGGYYQDDGPGTHIPADIQAIPDAVPRIEAHAPANMRPYRVLGKQYVPITQERRFREVGTASWYGRKFHGKKTANGETYDMYAMTAAHPTLPLPSYARVTHARSKKSVIVRINDRGPFHSSRVIDLSYVAAAKLGLIGPGSGQVIVEAITHADIRGSSYQRDDMPAPRALPIPDAAPQAAPTLITRAADKEGETTSAGDALTALILQAGGADTPRTQAAATDSSPPASAQNAAQGTGVHSALYAPRNGSEGPARSAAHIDGSRVDGGESVVFLQYGAFSARASADGLAAALNQKIASTEGRRAEVSSSDLHRVRIGPYPSRTQAVNAAMRIQSETGYTPSYTTEPPRPPASRQAVSL